MRTNWAGLALVVPTITFAHGGHGAASALHAHAGDLMAWLGVAAVVALWLWRRSGR
jgi:hypothetical protein